MLFKACSAPLLLRVWGWAGSLTIRNAVSGYGALVWLSLISILTVPIYIRLLGVSEWGLVAACASLQVLSNFIDAGFSQIVPRWAAQEARSPARLHQYVALFRQVYLVLGLLLFLVLQVTAGYVSHHWFQVSINRADALELAIRIVSFQFFFQFINNLHIGLWNGLQHQVLANTRACLFGTLKHAAALTSLMIWTPQVWIYALAFAIVAFLEVCINAITVRQMLALRSVSETFTKLPLGPLLKEVSVLSGGILLGLLVSQLDRIILSRTVDLESFGIYTIVATVALAFLQLQAPVTRAYFPILVEEIQARGRVSGTHMKKLLVGTIFACTLPALLTCALAPQILALWMHDPKIVSIGTAPLRLLLLAIALNSLYGCIYQVIIAKGQSRRVIQFNFVSLVGAAVLILALGNSGGILLGGMIWVSTSLIQLMLGVAWYIKNR